MLYLGLKSLVLPPGIFIVGAARLKSAPEYGGSDTVGADLLLRLRYAAKLQRESGLPVLVSDGAGYQQRVPEADLMAWHENPVLDSNYSGAVVANIA